MHVYESKHAESRKLGSLFVPVHMLSKSACYKIACFHFSFRVWPDSILVEVL